MTAITASAATAQAADGQTAHAPYRVSIEQYRAFRRDGFLVVRGLVGPEDIAELRQHTEDLMQGQLPEQQVGGSLEAPPAHLSPEEKVQHFLRIHMLHRKMALHERYLLHPRVLDVLEVLIGPDLLALQTMLFLKPPGKPGQGWHQDSYYIPTAPDTLCGAWIAIDDADELNGAMWMAKGSQSEPVYPPREGYGYGDTQIDGIPHVVGVSDTDDDKNDLSPVANRYDQALVSARAGDVAFFGGHILHRSKRNFTTDRVRRSFVGHYCNARSWTAWGGDSEHGVAPDLLTGGTNASHILARGDTHLPFAQPRFGTACAAALPAEARRGMYHGVGQAAMMGDRDSGLMDMMPMAAEPEHGHDEGED